MVKTVKEGNRSYLIDISVGSVKQKSGQQNDQHSHKPVLSSGRVTKERLEMGKISEHGLTSAQVLKLE
jgi:hypothetical protein